MRKKKPDWLKINLASKDQMFKVNKIIKEMSLNTVCSAANCPNKMECFNSGTATFMIMGNLCTRNCKFCNVETKKPEALDPEEPKHLALAVKEMGLKHVVVTSVDRDDLADYGANHFKEVVREIRKSSPETSIELLIPDMKGKEDLIDIIINEEPEVLNHNIETVPRLYKDLMPQCNYELSLGLLDYVKKQKPHMKTKTGLIVGLGESKEEVIETLKDLRKVDCDIVTIGQYLQPTLSHWEIDRYVEPAEFKEYEKIGYDLGFKKVIAGPLVRSSYKAENF